MELPDLMSHEPITGEIVQITEKAREYGRAAAASKARREQERKEGKTPTQDPRICMDISSPRFIPEDRQRVDIVMRKIVGDRPINFTTTNKPGERIENHFYPVVSSHDVTGIPLEQAPGVASESDDKKFITLAELASIRPPKKQNFHSVPIKDAIPFVIIYKDEKLANSSYRWENPDHQRAYDILNEVLCGMYEINDPRSSAYLRT